MVEEIQARADEFADAFENYEPQPGDEEAPISPVMEMRLAAWRRDVAEKELAEAIGTTGGAAGDATGPSSRDKSR